MAGLIYGGSTAGASFRTFSTNSSLSLSTNSRLVPTVCGFGAGASVTVTGRNAAGSTGTVGTFTANASGCVATGAFQITSAGTYAVVFSSSARRVTIQINAFSPGTQAGIGLPQTGYDLLPVAGAGLLLLLLGSVLLFAQKHRSGRRGGQSEPPQV